MKKCLIVPLASGYYNKAKSMSEEYGIDFDDRDLKPNQKIQQASGKYKNIVAIGNMYILNDKVISPDDLKKELENMNKKKREKVVVEETNEKVIEYTQEKNIEDL